MLSHLRGRWVNPSHYHVTVQFLGLHRGLPPETIARMKSAAGAARWAPFDITFDRADSFCGSRRFPCVLRCDQTSETPLQALWRELGAALRAQELGQLLREPPFIPHLTIAYADAALREPMPIQPIRWRVQELVLVASHVGQSLYEPLATWLHDCPDL